jgi:amino acid adenylation domain-containing protein
MMTRQLLQKLKDNQIDVVLNGDTLDIHYDGELDKAILDEIVNNKQQIVSFLSKISRNANGFSEIPVAPLQPVYPLSSSQKRIWVLSQFDDANSAYNDPAFFWFEGDLNVDALEMSFRELIQRHEILRTVFKQDDSAAVNQVVCPADSINFRMAYDDLSNEADPDKKAKDLIEKEIFTPFDLLYDSMIRARLLRLNGTRFVLVYVLHHIVSDGWSMKILISELLSLYISYTQKKPDTLPSLRIQYKDYAVWEQEQIQNHRLDDHKEYWLGQFSGELPVLEVPGNKLRPSVKTYNGAKRTKTISRDLNDALKQLCRNCDGTLFMGLLGLVNALLYRYTTQSDNIIGTAIAGRENPELQDQIGYYINALPLRVSFNGSDSFSDLFMNVKKVTLDAYEHQAYPFDVLVDDLALQYDRSRTALLDVSVVLQNTNVLDPGPELQNMAGIKVGVYEEITSVASKNDLAFTFEEINGALHVSLVYNTDIYNAAFAERLLEHLNNLLECVVIHPDIPLDELKYLSKEETELLLNKFNDTAYDYPRDKTIIDLFEEQAGLTPDHVAIVYDEKKITYKELNERSNQLAAYLRKNYAVQPDDLIGIKLERREQIVIAILGVLKSGAAYFPIDAEYPESRIAYMVEDSRCKVMIDEEELERFQAVRSMHSKNNLPSIVQPRHLAYVIYTSGSTGKPKGVMIAHGSLVNLCVWHKQVLGVTTLDRASLYVRVAFDASVMELFPYLIAGAALFVIPKDIHLDFYLLSEFCHSNQLTICAFPPPILEQFVEFENNDLRYLITGGDKLRKPKQKNYKIVNQYGTTEATVVSTNYILDSNDPSAKPSIGRPIYNTQVYILDANEQLVPVGIPGEVCIGGEGLARGYLHNEELTREKFTENPFRKGERIYKTGDLCRWTEDGNIEYLERKNNQVKIRGFRVELGEVETALQRYKGVDNAVAMAKELSDGEQIIVAYVASKQELSMHELRNYLKEILPEFMIPKYIVRLDTLPVTSNGKIDRKSLPNPQGLNVAEEGEYVAPGNNVEERLVKIWEEVLSKDGIGIKHDFFEMGGHSLKATRLSARIHKEFGVKISLNELFSNTKLEAQALLIDSANRKHSRVEESGTTSDPSEIYSF